MKFLITIILFFVLSCNSFVPTGHRLAFNNYDVISVAPFRYQGMNVGVGALYAKILVSENGEIAVRINEEFGGFTMNGKLPNDAVLDEIVFTINDVAQEKGVMKGQLKNEDNEIILFNTRLKAVLK